MGGAGPHDIRSFHPASRSDAVATSEKLGGKDVVRLRVLDERDKGHES
jgi:hypothetical protein